MMMAVLLQTQPTELVLTLLAGHVIAALGLLDRRFAAGTFSV
jgi:hypothetical protein